MTDEKWAIVAILVLLAIGCYRLSIFLDKKDAKNEI